LAGNLTGNVTGNADTATALQTARTIGGVSFDGTADINLPGVNQTGNQNTSGSAATLTTARTLTIGSTGKTFDGSADVAWSLSEIGAQASSAQLTSLAALATNGIIARTAANTVAARIITGTADQITVTDGDGVSGSPTIAAVVASQAEAEAGTDNTKLMTPLRTREAVNYLLQTPWVVVSPSSAPTYTANLTSTNRTVRFFFSNVRNTSSSAAILRVRVSTDSGSTWSPYINISQSANWSVDGIWGEIEFWKQKKSTGLPNYVGGLSSVTNSALGFVAVTNFPDETSATLAFNRVEFSWTTGNLNGGNIGLCTIRQLET